MTKRSLHQTTLSVLLVALSITIARGQDKAAANKDVVTEHATASGSTYQPEVPTTDLLAQARRPNRFALKPGSPRISSAQPVFIITPAVGSSTPVIGSGTSGRLTKWM